MRVSRQRRFDLHRIRKRARQDCQHDNHEHDNDQGDARPGPDPACSCHFHPFKYPLNYRFISPV